MRSHNRSPFTKLKPRWKRHTKTFTTLPEFGAWPVYKEAFDELEADIKDFIKDHGELKGMQVTPKLDPVSQAIEGVQKNVNAFRLSSSMKTRLTNIETQGHEVEFLWLEVEFAWYVYYDAVAAYNSHPHRGSKDQIWIQEPSKKTPTPLYFCAGSCDDLFETASLAQVSHQVYCPEKHGELGVTGVTYYTCSDSGTCHRSYEHWLVCGGVCGEKFAPRHLTYNYYVANSPHYVKCEKNVYSQVPGTKCGTEYYTCEYQTCPDKNSHLGSASLQPCGHTYDPNSSEAYLHRYGKYSCGLHRGYKCKEGDHGIWIASCSETDEHGQACTNTSGYWKCSPHQHTYPPPSPPHPICGGCGKSYDPDSASDINRHRLRTCRYGSCGKSWRRCQTSTPICDKPYRKRNGLRCWAADP